MKRPCAPDPGRAYGEDHRRYLNGERQKYCGTCELWQFTICADGWHDQETEDKLNAFYAAESRKRRKNVLNVNTPEPGDVETEPHGDEDENGD